MYNSIDLTLPEKEIFAIGDGILFWHYNKWQPMYGCCKVLEITKNGNKTQITVASKENIVICNIVENRVCWYPNFNEDNIQLLENLHIDASQKLSRTRSKWNGRKLCISHSRSYLPHDLQFNIEKYDQNSNSRIPKMCCVQNTLYSIDAAPFLSSQSLTDLENISTNFEWHFPPSYIQWTCQITGRNFEKDFPKEYKFLKKNEFKLDFRPSILASTTIFDFSSSDNEIINDDDIELDSDFFSSTSI